MAPSDVSWRSVCRFFLDPDLPLLRMGEQLEPSPLTLMMTSLSVTWKRGMSAVLPEMCVTVYFIKINVRQSTMA